MAEKLEEWENSLPPHISLAYLPNPMAVRLRLSARGDHRDTLVREVEEKINTILSDLPNIPDEDVLPGGKENNKVVKEFDTNIEVTVEVSTSQTTATSLEVVLTLDVSGSMWECSKSSWFSKYYHKR